MTKNKLEQLAVWLALGAGGLDLCTGLGFVQVPTLVLKLMGATLLGAAELVYLRWIGAFVAAVGFSYLWPLIRSEVTLLRAATARGPSRRECCHCIWVSVPVTDFALAAAQVWLLRRGVFR